jgi:hypothetical protein
MRRSRFATLSALSLVLSIMVAALWLHSQFRAMQVYWSNGYTWRSITSDSGKLVYVKTWGGSGGHPFGPHWRMGPARIWGGAHLVDGLRYGRFGFGDALQSWVLGEGPYVFQRQTWLPYWSLVALTLLLPVAWSLRWTVLRLRRYLADRRESRRGLCPVCGYDLRASKDYCPECGTTVPLIAKA